MKFCLRFCPLSPALTVGHEIGSRDTGLRRRLIHAGCGSQKVVVTGESDLDDPHELGLAEICPPALADFPRWGLGRRSMRREWERRAGHPDFGRGNTSYRKEQQDQE